MAVDVSEAMRTPWKLADEGGSITDNSGRCVALVYSEDGEKYRWYFECGRQRATLIVEAVNNYSRLKRVEKLAGELADDIKIAAFPPGYEGDPLYFNSLQIDGLLAKVHELRAEIGKRAA